MYDKIESEVKCFYIIKSYFAVMRHYFVPYLIRKGRACCPRVIMKRFIEYEKGNNASRARFSFAFFIACALFFLCAFCFGASADTGDALHSSKFPELLITEVCSDTFGFDSGASVINKNLVGKGGDTYEFIEIYNNSDHRINIYDYCLLYNGNDSSKSTFETEVVEMTPFASGKGWIDGWDASKYWTGKTKMPENPAYEDGYVEPGRCVVIWVLYFESHLYNCTVEEFRAYWHIPSDVLVICFDGNGDSSGDKVTTVNGNSITKNGNSKNFNVKNSAVGAYAIAKKTDEIAYANKSGITLKQVFSTTDDIISWTVMDYPAVISLDPNYVVNAATTVNFIPSFESYNGLYKSSGGKRTEYLCCTQYESSSVGRLTKEQIEALGERYVYLNAGEKVTRDYKDGVISYYYGHVESGEGFFAYTGTFTAPKSGIYVESPRDAELRTGGNVSVRVSGESGIRFASYISRSAYKSLLNDESVESVKLGTLIAPRLYAEKCKGEFTAEKMSALGLKYLDVVAEEFYDRRGGELMIAGSVLEIKEKNYLLEYSARAYLDITLKSGQTCRVYADFEVDANSRSPYSVALSAYNRGQSEALTYIDGVCDLTKNGASVTVRPYAEALDGFVSAESITVTENFSARSDANLNVWITSENGKNPRLIFLDGTLIATLVGDTYQVNGDAAFSVTNEKGGALVSLCYTSALDGIENVKTTKKDSASLDVLSGVKVDLELVYSHNAETKNSVKYYILQSCCSDGKYIYYCMNNSANLINMLVKAELETGKIVAQTYNNDFDHANGITYNVRTHELVIVHNDNGNKDDTNNKKWISIVDADTLAVKETKMLSHKLYALDYVASLDQYFFGIAGTYNYVTYTSNFTSTDNVYAGQNTGITKQDMSVDCKYVIYPQFTTYNKKTLSYLSVFTRSGNSRVGLIELYSDSGVYYEIEDCFSIGGQMYFAYYCSGNGFKLYRANITVK